MDEKKFPVLYYDLDTVDVELVQTISNQLAEYFQREKVPFILLPKDVMTLKLLSKKEALDKLRDIMKEVESWEE